MVPKAQFEPQQSTHPTGSWSRWSAGPGGPVGLVTGGTFRRPDRWDLSPTVVSTTGARGGHVVTARTHSRGLATPHSTRHTRQGGPVPETSREQDNPSRGPRAPRGVQHNRGSTRHGARTTPGTHWVHTNREAWETPSVSALTLTSKTAQSAHPQPVVSARAPPGLSHSDTGGTT